MKLGCMLYSFSSALNDGTLTIPQALDAMREFGARGADLMHARLADYSPGEITNMLADAELELAAYIGGANLTTADPDDRQAAVDSVRAQIDKAAQIGAKQMLVTTGICGAGQPKQQCRQNVGAALSPLVAHAAEHEITLSIEDFGNPASPHQTAAECLQVCDLAGGDLMITYDSGNMLMGDEDPVEFLQRVRHRIVHAHAKDWERLGEGAEARLTSREGHKYDPAVVGEGVVNYPAIIAALNGIGYEGYLSFEYEGTDDPIRAADRGMRYLRTLLQS